jgi:hypothetical protein
LPAAADRVAPTGLVTIDRRLGGGLRRGQISEIVGPRSSGRTSLLCQLLASATARGELVAIVDTLDRFDPESAAAQGVDLAQLLWVRGTPLTPPGRPRPTDEWPIDRAVKAINLVLQAGGFGVVALDLADVSPAAIRRLPFTTWLRLARVIEPAPTVGVLLGQSHIARSPAGATIALTGAARWTGTGDRSRLYGGIESRIEVVNV